MIKKAISRTAVILIKKKKKNCQDLTLTNHNYPFLYLGLKFLLSINLFISEQVL